MTNISITFLLFVLLTNVKYSEPNLDLKDYCKLSCQGQKNTVCKRAGAKCGLARGCKYIKPDQKFRELMVHQHNDYRNKIASGEEKRGTNTGASNMHSISYDLELEFIAQCHVNECDFNHDKCRKSKRFENVGQNLFQSSGDPNEAVSKWFEEIEVFKGPLDNFQFDPGTGHYTQIVWALTTHIGCARATGKSMTSVFCNYGPAGNFLGETIYKTGAPASECQTVNKKYPALCGDEIDIPADKPWYDGLTKTSGGSRTKLHYETQLKQFLGLGLPMIACITWVL